ncbi:hypothetical protein JXM67_06540 [candidate division WOR-3 bacterium]|nr:hypothetical protein [candidate division WOR-3 bacterium]
MSEYFKRLEERLAASRITVEDARDGLLESYVVANRKALDVGLTDLALDASDEAVYKKLYEVMGELLAERGADIERPSVRDLRSVRHTMDLKLRHIEFPPEISQMHEIASETLLEKAVDEDEAPGAEATGGGELDEFEKLKKELSEEMGASIQEVQELETPSPTEEVHEPSAFKFVPKEEKPAVTEPQASVRGEPPVEEPSLDDLFIKTLEERLDNESLSPAEARDGIIEAYVIANRNAVSLGDVGLAPDASDAEIELRVRNMMRGFFREHGSSFDEPDLELLVEAKRYLDEQWDITRMPEQVRTKHDDLCKALMTRAENLQAMVEGEKAKLSVGSFTPSVEKPDIEIEVPVVEASAVPAPEPETPSESVAEVLEEPSPQPEIVAEPELVETSSEPEPEKPLLEAQTEEVAEPLVAAESESVEESEPEPLAIEEPAAEEEPLFQKSISPGVVPEDVEQTEAEIETPTVPEPTSEPAPTQVSVDDLIAKVKADLREIVKAEVQAALTKPETSKATLRPPVSVSAESSGDTVFLAWLDVRGQPGYNVYKQEGTQWVRLTAIPLNRPSFSMKVTTEEEVVLAVTSVSSSGEESNLSEEIRVNVNPGEE